MEIKPDSCFEAWKKALKYIVDYGEDFKDGKRVCREVLNMVIKMTNTKDISKPIEELRKFKKWIYPPIEEIRDVMLNKENNPIYNYTYGQRVFNFAGKVDQVNNYIIPLLKNNPNSRRATISLWDPNEDSVHYKKEVASLQTMDFKLRNGKLNLTCYIRSCELFFGFPANIYQVHTLQKHIANKLNSEVGELTFFACSSHIFRDELEYISKIVED